jgi:hypothetical protein
MKKLILAGILLVLHGQLFALKMDITVTYDRAKAGDSLFLEYYDTFFPRIIKPQMVTAAPESNGSYKFCVDVDRPVRFSILKRLDLNEYPNLKGSHNQFNIILSKHLWKGDGALTIHITKNPQSAPQSNSPFFDFKHVFEGHGAPVHNAKFLADSALNRTERGYFGEVDHLIPWQIDHLIVWRPVAEKSCRSSFKISK